MSARTLKKIALYSSLFLIFFGGLFWGVGFLPGVLGLVARMIILVCTLFAAVYVLDMMIPGVNLLSRAPLRFPDSQNEPAVALTFDDGPVEPYTRQILDILDRNGVKATFFCIGENVDKNPLLAKEIADRGHTVANHTYNHRTLPFLSSDEIHSEIASAADAIARATGKRPTFFRCPKGYKTRRVLRIANDLGQNVTGYSYPIFDVENPPASKLIHRVLGRVKNGDVILMHDGFSVRKPGSRSSLVEALPEILKGIQERGLKVVMLS